MGTDENPEPDKWELMRILMLAGVAGLCPAN
jgi:hypothetical protein